MRQPIEIHSRHPAACPSRGPSSRQGPGLTAGSCRTDGPGLRLAGLTGFIRIYLGILVALIFLNQMMTGCATKQLSKFKQWHENEKYSEIIQSDIDCVDSSPECFQIKLIRADSYYRLNKMQAALKYANEAIQRITPEIPDQNVFSIYILRANIYFEQVKEVEEFARKKQMVNLLERDIHQALGANTALPASEKKESNEGKLQLLLAEALLMKLDIVEQDSLDMVYQNLLEAANKLGQLRPDEGYRQYYALRGEFKSILPEVEQFIFKGQGDQDALLERLKGIYQQGTALRNLPLYQQGYAGAIDRFLENVDLFMKQLVL